MAKVKIQGHASGTGILTVTAPNTSTDRTITLPDATGTLLNSDGSAASLTSIPAANITGTLPAISGANLTGLTSSQMPAGSVLQVVTATTASNTQVTSTSYTDTALTANITPSSTSNKVLVLVSQTVQGQITANTEYQIWVQLLRDSTSIQITNPLAGLAGTGSGGLQAMRTMCTMVQLDSPSLDSAITYKTQGKISTIASSATCRFQEGSTESSIVLMEIAG